MLKHFDSGPKFLKAGFLGFPKSGKTFTSVQLAAGIREMLGPKGPVAFFDTENGVDYVGDVVTELTGQKPLVKKSRSFDDLMEVGRECVAGGISVLIVDSITHIWNEVMESYKRKLNEALVSMNRRPRTQFTLHDLMKIKSIWAAWPNFYLTSPLHIIVCGRAGFEWNMVENDEGKKELTKTGVKMKVESEFGFEPSLLVEMERVQDMEERETKIYHKATVIGDRFNKMDGKTCLNPDFSFFEPYAQALLGGKHDPVQTQSTSNPEVDQAGDTDWTREKKNREILCEEIQGMITESFPGQSAAEKKSKAQAIYEVFQTRSWTKVQGTDSEILRKGLKKLPKVLKSLGTEIEESKK